MRGWMPGAIGAALIAVVSTVTSAEVAIVFEEGELVASGLSPGGEAALVGLARERRSFHARVVHHREGLTADAEGTVRYAVGEAVPERSLWVVADVASGEVALSAPPGFGVRRSSRLRPTIGSALDGGVGRLRLARETVEVLLVRPGVGAWRLGARDGSGADADRVRDGSVELALGELVALGSDAAPPASARAGDLVVVIDPDRMQVLEVRLDAAALGDAGLRSGSDL